MVIFCECSSLNLKKQSAVPMKLFVAHPMSYLSANTSQTLSPPLPPAAHKEFAFHLHTPFVSSTWQQSDKALQQHSPPEADTTKKEYADRSLLQNSQKASGSK